MAVGVEPKSLQELSLTHITMTLEQYSTDVLSLLPKRFREQLLRNIPVLDVCRLEEDSSFAAGIDVDSVWKELFYLLIRGRYKCITSETAWRELLFEQLFSIVVQGDRPFGYFDALSQRKRSVPLNNFGLAKSKLFNRSVPLHMVVKHTEMSLFNFPVSPGHTYHKSCRIHQLVPPRYAKLFPEDSCYLPDSTALQLITEKCRFKPKQLHIDIPRFATFLLNIEEECGSVDCLKDYFGEVECVSIQGSQHKRNNNSFEYKECKDVAGQALDLVLRSPSPVLTSLTVGLSSVDDVLESIEPALVSYCGLRNFTMECHGVHFLNFSVLSSIIKHQALLTTVSISEHVLYRADSLSHAFCNTDFLSWIQTCFENPSLRELKLALYRPSSQLVLQVISVFLSTPCSHKQTLFITLTLGSRPTPIATSFAKEFDEALTLKYKCLSLDTSKIGDTFANAFLLLAPLKLKKLIFQESVGPKFLCQVAKNPRIEMEALELLSPELPDQSEEFFNLLLRKESLKSIKYSCSNKNAPSFNDTTLKCFNKKCVSSILNKKTCILERKLVSV